MRKTSIFLGVLLAGSVAFAAEPATTPQANNTGGAKVQRNMGDVKESFKDMGRSARNVTNDLTNRDGKFHTMGSRNATGYGGDAQTDFSSDAQRRARMDAAYANWQARR